MYTGKTPFQLTYYTKKNPLRSGINTNKYFNVWYLATLTGIMLFFLSFVKKDFVVVKMFQN